MLEKWPKDTPVGSAVRHLSKVPTVRLGGAKAITCLRLGDRSLRRESGAVPQIR